MDRLNDMISLARANSYAAPSEPEQPFALEPSAGGGGSGASAASTACNAFEPALAAPGRPPAHGALLGMCEGGCRA